MLERKEDAKKRGVESPDKADALALTFYMNPRSYHIKDSELAFARMPSHADDSDYAYI